jgi:integrase/recombinase XerD
MSAKTERLFRFYENELQVRYAEETIPSYRFRVRVFLEWLCGRGVELLEARTEDLQSYQQELLALRNKDGKPYSLGTQHNHLTAVKSFFRFLYQNGYLLHDPAASLEYHRKENRLPRTILTENEARRLLDEARETTPVGLRDRALLETLYATGLRVGELTKLGLDDVDTEERILRVVLGKGRKDRNVPLIRAAAEAIERYLEAGRPALVRPSRKEAAYLFLAEHGGHLQRAVVCRILQRYAKRARLRKRVSPHTIRHSVATHLLRGRADIRHIQKLLGHASLETTQRYTRVEISDLKRVIARAHPRR